MRSALSHTSQARRNMTAAHRACTAPSSRRWRRGPSTRSMKSMSACSSAYDTSGSPAKIRTSNISSVTSKAPRTGRLNTYLATTSTKVRSIMASRMVEATTPSTATARRSQPGGRSLMRLATAGRRGSLAGRDLLQLRAKLGEDLGGVHTLGTGLLDPVIDDGRGALLDLGHEGRVGLHDLDPGLLQRLQALLVGLVPGSAGQPCQVLAGDLADRLLVLLGKLVPLVLVHEEAEGRAVHAARKQRRLLQHGVELDRDDGLHRKEHTVGNPALQELVGFGSRLDEGGGPQRLGDRFGDATARANLEPLDVVDASDRTLGEHLAGAVREHSEQLHALVFVDLGEVLPVDSRVRDRVDERGVTGPR